MGENGTGRSIALSTANAIELVALDGSAINVTSISEEYMIPFGTVSKAVKRMAEAGKLVPCEAPQSPDSGPQSCPTCGQRIPSEDNRAGPPRKYYKLSDDHREALLSIWTEERVALAIQQLEEQAQHERTRGGLG